MPVLGHAFVGVATAMTVRPSGHAALGTAFWMPLLVSFAYLPDITAQAGVLVGLLEARIATHSIVFALAAAALLSLPVARLGRIAVVRALVVVLISVLLHDLCDLLQTTDRKPLWPFSDRHLGPSTPIIPQSVWGELAVFAGLFAVFAGARVLATRGRDGTLNGTGIAVPARREKAAGGQRPSDAPDSEPQAPARGPASAALVWLGRALTVIILFLAAGTHALRGLRERDMRRAQDAVSRRDLATALNLAAAAARWPGTPRPGEIDYLKAEAYEAAGDRRRAEAHYLLAHAADSSHFWSLADLAVLYATAEDEPLGQRRLRVAPYVQELRTRFAGHADLPRVLDKIDRKLAHREPSS